VSGPLDEAIEFEAMADTRFVFGLAIPHPWVRKPSSMQRWSANLLRREDLVPTDEVRGDEMPDSSARRQCVRQCSDVAHRPRILCHYRIGRQQRTEFGVGFIFPNDCF
jgi:hypothetical protein